jgi:HEAT repeat protein
VHRHPRQTWLSALLLLLAVLPALPVRGGTREPQVARSIAMLSSDDLGVRLQGFNEISARLAAGELAPGERQELITALLPVARVVEHAPQLESAPLLAIELLGELKAPEAVPVLLDRLLDQLPRWVVSDLSALLPAVVALAKVGAPAVAPILDRAGTASAAEWTALRQALGEMKDQEAVRSAARQRLASATGDTARQRLRAL